MTQHLPPHHEPEEFEMVVGKLRLRLRMHSLKVAIIVLGLLMWAYFILELLWSP